MQLTTPYGLYFHGKPKELHDFLTNLSNHYTTIRQLPNKKSLKIINSIKLDKSSFTELIN